MFSFFKEFINDVQTVLNQLNTIGEQNLGVKEKIYIFFWLFVDNQAVIVLIKSALNFFVKYEFAQFSLDELSIKVKLFSNKFNLDSCIGFDNLKKVHLQQFIVKGADLLRDDRVASDHYLLKTQQLLSSWC